MNVSDKWKFGGRRTAARQIAAELRHKLHKWPRSRRHEFIDVRASAAYWQLVFEALEEVTKLEHFPPFEEDAVL